MPSCDWPLSGLLSPQSSHRRGQLRSASSECQAPASLDIDWSGGTAGSASAQSSSRQQYFTPSLQARSEAFLADDNILLVPTETSVSEVDNQASCHNSRLGEQQERGHHVDI